MKAFCMTVASISLGLLSACGTPSPGPDVISESVIDEDRAIHDEVLNILSGSVLMNMRYTLTDPTVRQVLSRADQPFSVELRHGAFVFPPSALVAPFSRVEADEFTVQYGDLTGDGLPEATVVFRIGSDDDIVTELATVSVLGGIPKHIASFPLGRAELRSLRIVSGSIIVNLLQNIPGDPGPRNTELILQLPRQVGSGSGTRL